MHGTKAEKMQVIQEIILTLTNKKSSVERFLGEEKKHNVYMLPKYMYHCELNPIERVWAQAKRYSKAYCKYSIVSLRKTITPALESVTLESMQKHFRKVRHYMFAYLEGIPGGSELEELVKKYKKEIKSHRRISEVQQNPLIILCFINYWQHLCIYIFFCQKFRHTHEDNI